MLSVEEQRGVNITTARLLRALGDNVKKYRREKQLTQNQLACLIDTAPSTISSIECCDRNNITLSIIVKLAKALDTNTLDLLS